MDLNVDKIMETAPELIMTYGLKFVMAIVVFLVGKWLAKLLSSALGRGLAAKNIDPTVAHFTKNIAYYALFAMVVVAALGQLGIQTASFVAIVGAAGLAVGFALQGSLANFAAGVLLILFRPFKVGDYVEAGGTAGVVKEVSIFSTILTTPDNKVVIIANNAVMSNNITNYSTMPTRRVDLKVGISYGSDIKLAKQVMQDIADADSRILKDPAVQIAVSELADSSVNFVFRSWVNSADYWGVFFDFTEQVKLKFDEKGIEIPFPQMDVHLDK
ncbi:mechanosensitive ion channel [Aestuariicella hydrocarbonica]|uniref:Small-conductance mechanosensitive channel n=1 Tax=Pseudomaricurvus hydrocarbonicus TaxID=1470433 RepID=A0A9E5MMJ4_9GAMM|nr:mechanosensitive ion channel domain-containing protein [Aestuariicella hydrocarbonica]NHO66935.1 mechanosensitive ion channel [Aestuariicella hydrocarbonica]